MCFCSGLSLFLGTHGNVLGCFFCPVSISAYWISPGLLQNNEQAFKNSCRELNKPDLIFYQLASKWEDSVRDKMSMQCFKIPKDSTVVRMRKCCGYWGVSELNNMGEDGILQRFTVSHSFYFALGLAAPVSFKSLSLPDKHQFSTCTALILHNLQFSTCYFPP